MKGLIQANLQLLKQGVQLLDGLDDGTYTRPEPMFYNSTVGGHLRHSLEHYEAFCKAFAGGASEGKIDYDARCRDALVENKTTAARARIAEIIITLKELGQTAIDPGVLVKMDCGHPVDHSDDLWQPSTVGRELQFLVSHTVHHFAMIRGICQSGGDCFDKEFGMAPSTLRHQKQVHSPSVSR